MMPSVLRRPLRQHWRALLPLPEPRRVRDRDHVRYVAKQSSLVCGQSRQMPIICASPKEVRYRCASHMAP